ncbi:EamA family transporter [Alkanindiges sp. WGS2144]|uniref:EamA family transporter n=1 Tax=Alkanindiges sp. WGS2144 TaxID=3366808 RepID=UPI003753185F
MPQLLLAALCSVLVSLLLKWSVRRGASAMALISWNYVAAVLLTGFLLKPDFTNLLAHRQTSWLALVALGVLLPGIFLALSKSLQRAGLIKTEVAQRMSLLLSLLAAYWLFHESFTRLKIVGIGLGLVAVLGLIFSTAGKTKNTAQFARHSGILLLVWVGYAAVDVLLKYISTLGYSTSTALFASFSIALTGLVVWQAVQGTFKQLFWLKHIGLGLSLGVLNFCNIWFYIKAHQQLASNPAIVFASMNILVVLLGVIAGLVIFKEKLKKSGWVFVASSIVAIVVLYYARLA